MAGFKQAAKAAMALLGLTTLLAFGPSAAAPAPAKQPNIVLILIDDAGYTDLRAYGSEIATPTLDALAVHAQHLARELIEGRRIMAEIAVAHQRLAGHLQQHPAEPWRSLANLAHGRSCYADRG